MEKKTLLILSLVFTVLYLIYMFLSYYGIIRYGLLHFHNIDYYVKNYPKLPKNSDVMSKLPKNSDRVVIHFSTDNMSKLTPFINSLLDQTIRVDEIAVSLPYKDMKNIPEYMKKVLSVYGYSKNYNDAGKLIPVLLREQDANTKIIIVEPNIVYGKDFIEEMVDQSDMNPNNIIKNGDTILIKPEFFNNNVSEYDTKTNCNKWIEKCSNVDTINFPYSTNFKTL
jgi:hypothetical protein